MTLFFFLFLPFFFQIWKEEETKKRIRFSGFYLAAFGLASIYNFFAPKPKRFHNFFFFFFFFFFFVFFFKRNYVFYFSTFVRFSVSPRFVLFGCSPLTLGRAFLSPFIYFFFTISSIFLSIFLVSTFAALQSQTVARSRKTHLKPTLTQ